jgi:hypothetical protein
MKDAGIKIYDHGRGSCLFGHRRRLPLSAGNERQMTVAQNELPVFMSVFLHGLLQNNFQEESFFNRNASVIGGERSADILSAPRAGRYSTRN